MYTPIRCMYVICIYIYIYIYSLAVILTMSDGREPELVPRSGGLYIDTCPYQACGK